MLGFKPRLDWRQKPWSGLQWPLNPLSHTQGGMEAPEPPPSGVLRTCLFVKEICVFGRVFSPLQKHRLFSAGGGTGLDVLLALSFLWLQFLIPPYLGNVFMMNTCYSFLPIGLSELVSVCVWLLPKDFLQKHESKYLPSNCCWSCFRLGRCSQHWAALIIDLIFRNAYSFFFFFPHMLIRCLSCLS